jgi:trk system potassium uptake protein TrkH
VNTTLRRLGPNLNWQLVIPVISGVLLAMGAGLLACCVVAIAGGDGGVVAFGLPALVVIPSAALGLLSAGRLRSMPLLVRDGFFAVTAAWLAAALVGAAPLLIEGTFDRAVDAFFESMSGFTTTGATLLDDIEREPDAILLWRSMSQWIGGVGIVVLVVAIAPATGLASQRVFYAETSGVTADRLTPRIADTAKIIWAIYLTLTGLAIGSYWIAGMTPWDAVNHSFTTTATGGFSTRTASIAAFDSLAVELVAVVFMAASGINFAFYWRAMRGGTLWPQAAEVRLYLLVLAGSIGLVATSLALAESSAGVWESLRESAFTVTSIVTTTGYTTVDFDEWGDYARMHLLLLMFIGGCAGSTAGGMKVIRVLLLGKAAVQEVQRQLRPQAVQVLRTRGRVFSEEVRRGVLGFFYIYVAVFLAGTVAMTASGLDLVTALSSVAATLNVIGPSLGEVGAAENYGAVSEGGLVILSALMLIGRLEVFTVLVLLTPAFWRPRVA